MRMAATKDQACCDAKDYGKLAACSSGQLFGIVNLEMRVSRAANDLQGEARGGAYDSDEQNIKCNYAHSRLFPEMRRQGGSRAILLFHLAMLNRLL